MHQLWMHNQYGKKFETRMSTSSKGLNERHRLHAYVSTTVYDRSWKGTTEQFVLHFHEQFRQLDELSPLNEQLLTGFYLKLNSFWSCSQMNCCLHYMLHINLHFLYICLIELTLNLKEFQESKKYIKSYQENKMKIILDELFSN